MHLRRPRLPYHAEHHIKDCADLGSPFPKLISDLVRCLGADRKYLIGLRRPWPYHVCADEL